MLLLVIYIFFHTHIIDFRDLNTKYNLLKLYKIIIMSFSNIKSRNKELQYEKYLLSIDIIINFELFY